MATGSRKWLRWMIAGIVLLVVFVVGGPFVYINFIRDDAPPRLELSSPTPSSTVAGVQRVALAGTWNVSDGSTAGYRVDEVLFGQNATVAGRTSDVTGSVVIAGTTVTDTEMEVDLTTVESDEDRRDRQFHGRIMDTAEFPTATFTLTQPIDLGGEPEDGTPITVPAIGELTLHGTTNAVTTDLEAQRTGEIIEVKGTIPVEFADYNIPNPSFGGITTEDHGELEFLLKLTRA